MSTDNVSEQPSGLGDEPQTNPVLTRRRLLFGAAGVGALGIGGIIALNSRGGGGTDILTDSTTSPTTSPSRTSTSATTSRTTSATTTAATTTTAPPTTTAATTTVPPATTSKPTTTSKPPTSSQPPPPPPPPPTSSTPPPPPPPPPPTKLRAFVGKDDGDSIGLTDDSGSNVKMLPPGNYTILVKDYSQYHNFHLFGPGVDQQTSVEEVTDATWSVTLQSGRYDYQCDPHASMMKGDFTVS